MKTLRLTIFLEPGLSKAALKNTFGFYDEFIGPKRRFVQFTFNSVKMLTATQLKPIQALVNTFEMKHPLYFKMYHLHDDEDNSFSPTRICCENKVWSLEYSASDAVIAKGKTLFDLF